MSRPSPLTRFRSAPRRARAFWTVAAGLSVLWLATLGVGAWRAASVGPRDVERAREATATHVRGELAALVARMRRHGESVALLPEIRAALAADTTVDARALAALGGRGQGERQSIEVLTPGGAIVAWDGPDVPRVVDPPPDTLRTQTIRDDANRSALAVWVPVLAEGRVLGAVRVAQVVQAAVPVRNRYLQDYDVADAWRPTPVPFTIRFPAIGPGTTLAGPDGTDLARVDVGVPSVPALAAERQEAARSLAAVWGLLLLAWSLAGLGALLARAVRAARLTGRWRPAIGAFLTFVAGLAATRWGLLALDVPVRWLDEGRRPAALFDPALLASDFGFGALRSPGDLAVSAVILLVAAATAFAVALRAPHPSRSPVGHAVGLTGVAGVAFGSVSLAGRWIHHAVLDATIPYADQAGPLLSGPMAAVLAGLLAVLAAALLTVGAAVLVIHRRGAWAGVAAVAGAVGAGALGLSPMLPALALAGLGALLAVALSDRPSRWALPLTFRGTLLASGVLALVLFATMQAPLHERTALLLADAAFAFSDNRDDRVTAAIDQVFDEARADDALGPVLLDALAAVDSTRQSSPAAADSSRRAVDALAAGLVSSSLLGSLADVATELRVVAPSGDTLGSYVERGAQTTDDVLGYSAVRAAYAARDGRPRALRVRAPFAERRGLRRTAAVGPLLDGAETVAWLYLRVTPRTSRFPTETPFPRVLAPTGLFGLDDEALGYAEYDDGVLVRQRGPAPLRLDSTVYAALEDRARSYRRPEMLDGRPTLAYYERLGDDAQDVVSVRAPAGDRLDALFVLLRLSLAGLLLGAVVVAVGLYVRRRAGLWPVARTRFRDKVLNRFLIVGLASVALTGVVGQSVIVEQNREAVRDQLRQRLSRAAAVFAAEPDAPGPRLDAVAAALGVDVHLYQGALLEATSRRQLVRQRLIEPRLPGEVYGSLYLDDQPFAFSEDHIGTFAYTTGYLAIPDSTGRPAAALAIPTLSEQAGIEAGRSRYVAYLFGGLLALMAAILVVAVLLAGQLTRPFGRLREGLRAVGAGEADDPIPVETSDEVGELVETFNAMQAALAESRRRLAEQEREMAWSTMARQVAHEIKNPLMPMKLSVQHLQRTFSAPDDEAPPEELRFAGQFERTTGMLIDQIETLDRIASDFSRFARMPNRAPESFDLSEVAEEAAALFEGPLAETPRATLAVELSAAPLPILADRDELRRVLVNLLTNALQAIPDRPAPGRIALATAEEDGTAVARVTDDGTGIADDVRDHVFEPSFSTKTSGMGLGLAISKRAVEASAGAITFETSTGGTTFTVRLPLAPGGEIPRDERGVRNEE
ncbi:ATP-binding protein [Rubrivirga sp. IMCC43871]|uniref:ATP-binding protein n=1 Tax=Rubrivirga sp. IMCC43871 TaxID=3391575 RepID=UPI00398FEB4E